MNATSNRSPIASYDSDYEAIIELMNAYFDGLYEGDVTKLRQVFHDDAVLKGPGFV